MVWATQELVEDYVHQVPPEDHELWCNLQVLCSPDELPHQAKAIDGARSDRTKDMTKSHLTFFPFLEPFILAWVTSKEGRLHDKS